MLAVAMTPRKAFYENVPAAIVAIMVVAFGILVIPINYPVNVSDGQITPSIVRPGDKVEVRWRQDWSDLCPITLQREFVGSDSFKKTSAQFSNDPPKQKGAFDYSGVLVIPELPAGDAYYHSVIQPHCLFDKLWQRTYRTPDIAITVIKPTPSGPR